MLTLADLTARTPYALAMLALTLLTLLGATSCTYDSASLSRLRCDETGQRDGDRICQDGLWIVADGLDMRQDMRSDQGPDADMTPCVPETDAQLCAQANIQCSAATITDRCGVSRAIDSCGRCDAGQVCDAAGRCVCLGESDEAMCQRLGKDCGQLTADDSCGVPRTVACGSCDAPNRCEDNVCVCQPESRGAFCGRLAKQCGQVNDLDQCGQPRVEDCGSCDIGACRADGTCPTCQPESREAFCARTNARCGSKTAPDNCGMMRTEDCGGCDQDENCNATNRCVCPRPSCPQGAECGSFTNACGQSRSCGSCTMPEVCDLASRTCDCPYEGDQAFCARTNTQCGSKTAMDNCGMMRTVNCGTSACTDGRTCDGATNTCVCPSPVCPQGAQCGSVTNACGSTTMCGSCSNERTCNTATRQCICPTPVCPQGAQCGSVTNACGNTTQCGVCSNDRVCDAAARTCDCPTPTCPQASSCGVITNACNATVDCGGCLGGDTCVNNVCTPPACTYEGDTTFCSRTGSQCGSKTAMDNCGMTRTVDCGVSACTDDRVCDASNQCTCPIPVCPAGAQCGLISNACGAMTSCGTCTSPQTCDMMSLQCVCTAENDEDFCTRTGAKCGSKTAMDNCGMTRTVDCGGCPMGQCKADNTCPG